jgi:hypothetical protein
MQTRATDTDWETDDGDDCEPERVAAVGNDFEMGPPGTCGKDGQGVPVGDGVPTLRVSSLTVGGTAA